MGEIGGTLLGGGCHGCHFEWWDVVALDRPRTPCYHPHHMNNTHQDPTEKARQRSPALTKVASFEGQLNAIAQTDDCATSRMIYRAAANALGRLRRAYERKEVAK